MGSWNSTAGAGFRYGLRFWKAHYATFRTTFRHDYKFLLGMSKEQIEEKHKFIPAGLPFTNTGNSFPREGKENPWHLIDLRDFIEAFANDSKIVNDDPHFTTFAADMGRHPCNNYYDLIIRQESLGEEMGFLARHLNMNLNQTDPTKLFHSNSNKVKNYENYVKLYLDPIPISIRSKL